MKLKHNSINFSVADITALLAINDMEESDVCVVTDENQGGTFIYRSADVGTNNGGTIFNGWCRQYDGAVNVKWFGLDNTGTTDNSALLETITNGDFTDIYFPDGVYNLSTEVLVNGSRRLFCDVQRGNNCVLQATAVGTGTLFRTRSANVTFENLNINGGGFALTLIAGEDETDIEDVDMLVNNCTLKNALTGINIKGRGLYATNNNFVTLTFAGINFSRGASPTLGTNPDQKTQTGFRSFKVIGNRFHGMGGSIGLRNSDAGSTYFRGLICNDNLIDTPIALFSGDCTEATFSGNVMSYGGNAAFVFNLAYNISINGNSFTALPDGGIENSPNYFGNIITVATACQNLTFNGNDIRGVSGSVIILNGATNGIAVNSNTMYDVLRDNGAYSIINYGADGDGLSFVGNTIVVNTAFPNTNMITRSATENVYRVNIENNSFNSAHIGEADDYFLTYKHGTFTPALVSVDGNSPTYTERSGVYQVDTSSGVVTCFVKIACYQSGTVGTVNSDVSQMKLTGLPFAIKDDTGVVKNKNFISSDVRTTFNDGAVGTLGGQTTGQVLLYTDEQTAGTEVKLWIYNNRVLNAITAQDVNGGQYIICKFQYIKA